MRGKKVRRATTVAYTDAWISAVFAGCGILSGCFGIDNLLIGLAMGFVAFNSFRGARGLKNLDLQAPGKLALNQLMLAAFLTLYFAYQLWGISTGKSALAQALSGSGGDYKDLGDMGASLNQVQDLVTRGMYIAYASLIAGTVIVQGLTALYYAGRKKYLQAYIEQTPRWVIDLQRARIGS